jgi:hypothetical protein
MSDHDQTNGGHDDHAHGGGGHEVDKMPSGRLFNLLFGLSGLTLVACIGVVQLFYRQVDSIRDTRDTRESFQLAEYRHEMDEIKGGRVLEISDDDGVPAAEGGRGVFEAIRYQMPLAEARKRVLEQPQQLLKAGRPYRGWRNPDANAPKPVAPTGPMPRNPARPQPTRPGVDGQPGGMAQPVVPGQPGGMAQPVVPVQPAQPGAEAPAKGEGKAEAEAPAKGEGKPEAKAPEGKANE